MAATRRISQQSDYTRNLLKHFENRILSRKFRRRPVGTPVLDNSLQPAVCIATIEMEKKKNSSIMQIISESGQVTATQAAVEKVTNMCTAPKKLDTS
ncbi:hypothetical protein D0T08_12755 [Emticicia sp. C21]|nr:hypothetical protein D0T08_12755 [Emticicia sp. C21]